MVKTGNLLTISSILRKSLGDKKATSYRPDKIQALVDRKSPLNLK